ncbi:MAG: ABC transporter ATP-binding protein [Clostridia bacterium]|nr:ABC transporter ATP-binding protein [Clostridia bacterium]
MNNKKAFLEVKDLVVEYKTGGKTVQAVNGISFSLESGRSLGMVGETGAGKTTVAKTILRILPELQSFVRNGEILLDGEDLLQLPEKDMLKIRGSKIAMIFQDPMTALNPVKRVGDQIAEAVLLHNDVNKGQAHDRACEMLEMVGIPMERYGEYPHQFSGGMKQRVVIAMALACNPKLLLADEPTTALDVTIQAQVLDMIAALKEKLNTSLIMITHDLGIVAEVCDDVAIVYAGQIVEYGTKEEIFDYPMHPYTLGLFGAIPNLTDDVERLSPIPGLPPDPTNLPKACYFSPRCNYCHAKCDGKIPLLEVRPGHWVRCCREM